MCIDDKYTDDSHIEHTEICGAAMNWKSCSARKKHGGRQKQRGNLMVVAVYCTVQVRE